MKNRRPFFPLTILLSFILFVNPPASLEAQSRNSADPKRLLVVYYDNKGAISSWIENFDNGLHSNLSGLAGKGLEINIEYTDLARNSSKAYMDQLIKLFEMKYGSRPPDVIIANMNPSSEFLSEICNNLFPNAKLILAVNETTLDDILNRYPPGTATGVYMEMRHENSPEIISRLLPDTRNIFVVNGNSTVEQIDIIRVKEVFDRYADRFNIDYLTGLTVDELVRKVSALPENSVIYFLTYMGDPLQRPYLSHDILSLLSEKANAPIFSIFDHYMGKGIVGGHLVSSEKMGEEAGEVAKRLLKGESPADIKPLKVASVKMFDWRQIMKWGIDESLLPEDSIIRYREYSFFERYRWRIIFWVSLVVLQFGLIAYLLMTLTKRRRAEDALFNSERKYRRLVESTRDAIISIDMNDRITSCNMGAMEIFGYSPDEMAGHSIMMLMPDEEQERHATNIRGVRESDGFMEYESIMKKKNGARIPVKISMSALKNESEEIIGLIKIIRDISDQKKAEEEKKKLESALRQSQKMEAIGTLAGGIAHDFNNILTAVIGYSEMALYNLDKNSREASNIKEVLKAGRRARDLVNQILTFARKSREEVRPILIGPIADDVLKLLRSTVPSSIEIRKTINTESLIMADRTRIHQIFLNICTNAVQAMDQDGGVLTVDVRDIKAVKEDGLRPGDYVKITISDTGIGIEKENLELIFDPYFTTKRTGEGTGLGLSVVHGIVEMYCGKISVESEVNRGTVFEIYLPATKLNEPDEDNGCNALPGGTERILFVDDEPSIVEMVRQLLESLGYDVICKNSSTEALELFRDRPQDFDLVITDMTMPHMNGDRLAAELINIRKDIRIILCTGYSRTMSEEMALKLGIKAFVMKPMEYSSLANTIRKVLDAPTI